VIYVYGFPAEQLDTLFRDFRGYMAIFARSGLPYGDIDAFELRVEGKEYERIPVTSDIWDEPDYVYFLNGGYRWGDSVV
jgi:hypothetical protein